MTKNLNDVLHNLFKALDDLIYDECYNYKVGLADFPSDSSIKALENYCKMFNQKSRALELLKELNRED